MSGKQEWSANTLPTTLKERYSDKLIKELNELLSAGLIEQRITGSTHLAFRVVGKPDITCSVTLTRTADNPVYAAKLRTFIRKAT